MSLVRPVKIIATILTVGMTFGVVLKGVASERSVDKDLWTPYALEGSNAITPNSVATVPVYSSDFPEHYGNNYGLNTDESALLIGLEDASDGFWQFSLDLNKPNESLFSEEQYRLNAAYSPSGDNSKFYINYGDRRVPVSIKVDDFLNYNKAGYEGNALSLGLDQKIGDSWAVSISYTKSELSQVTSGGSLLDFEDSKPTNQRYWFDLNKDGLPEAINLMSDLGLSSDFDKAYDGIEIRLTRQVSDQLSVGSSFGKANSNFDWQPFRLGQSTIEESKLKEETLSLFSQIDFTSHWSLDANLSHQYLKQYSPKIVSLVSDNSETLDFSNTTLDIGVQYQGRLDDMGLVIRIDLVNLLGHHESADVGQSDFEGSSLAPYTFETPKYIKLSGSINF